MSTTVTLRHEIATNPKDFVERIHWSEHYQETIHEQLGMRYELVKRDPETGERETRVWPADDVPAVARKVLGGDFHFHEVGQTDAATGRYDFVVKPSKGNVTVTGYQAVEPLGEQRLTRVVHFDIQAKLPLGVGKIVEAFVRKSLEQSYDQSAQLIGQYLRGEIG
jgi:hypothetical protein